MSMISTVATAVLFLSQPQLLVNVKASVAPQSPSDSATSASPVLGTTIQIYSLDSKITALSSALKAAKVPEIKGFVSGSQVFSASSPIADNANLDGSVFIQLGTPHYLGLPGFLFKDLLLTENRCPNKTDALANCEFVLPSVRFFDAANGEVQGLPADTSKIRIRIYREHDLRLGSLLGFVFPDNGTRESYFSKVYRSSEGKSLTVAEMKTLLTSLDSAKRNLSGFIKYDGILFDSAIEKPVDVAANGEEKLERSFALQQAASRIALSTRKTPSLDKMDRYLIERQFIKADGSASPLETAVIEVGPGTEITPASLNFR